MSDRTSILIDRIVRDIGEDHLRWRVPRGYPGVACAVLDSIYSTGNHYSGVQSLVSRYAALRGTDAPTELLDGPAELIATMVGAGGAEGFAELTNNRWRAWARKTAPLKSHVALEAAQLLEKAGLTSREAVQRAFHDRSVRESSEISSAWKRLPGQRSGLTWHYFLMLNGLPGVKADRMIRRFVTDTLGLPRMISALEASHLVEAAAAEIGVGYSTLDHAIWRFEARGETGP
ncbi:hypothetical protein [Brachybacterium paraconglomeratum]|uniref:hypothetical protein n=1 Tax=Brachybacterium paraconglomeratum TaxID=173362 RepID=UPI0037F5C288